jgi:DNA ligase-1
MLKPMLAGTCEDITKLNYPVIASPKLDGIRCTIQDGVVLSRNLKPIPSGLVQAVYGLPEFEGLDGELIYGDPTAEDCFNKTTSAVMRKEFPEDFQTPYLVMYVFDVLGTANFTTRLKQANGRIQNTKAVLVPHSIIKSASVLADYERHHTELGYEGVMVRSPDGPYKHGRSTVNQGYLLKIKQFKDAEAEILECIEQLHNNNEATIDELGHTKRSHEKAGMEPMNMLGALRVRDLSTGVEFNVGSGLTNEERVALWADKAALIGRIITYKYFPVGVKDKPRFPTFKGFRDPMDF